MGSWLIGLTTVRYQAPWDIVITCDGGQGSGVGIRERHTSFIRLTQVGVTAELLFLGQLEGDRDQTKLSTGSHTRLLLSFSFLYSLILSPRDQPLTRLLSIVWILSLSSVMKIMLLLFFFFLLFLSLTSASPTVTIPSDKLPVMLPLERGRVELQEVGDSGGKSLWGGRKGVSRKSEVNSWFFISR